MSQPVVTKYQEMTFGYLAPFFDRSQLPFKPTKALDLDKFALMDSIRIKTWMDSMDWAFVGTQRASINSNRHVRQLVLYTFLYKEDQDGNIDRVAVYARGKGATDELVGKMSIGFGGHLEVDDLVKVPATGGVSSYLSLIKSGIRELDEEISVPGHTSEEMIEGRGTLVGVICDEKPNDRDWIGNIHLGVVMGVSVGSLADFEVLEEKHSKLGWWSVKELQEKRDGFEPWTRYLIDQLLPAK